MSDSSKARRLARFVGQIKLCGHWLRTSAQRTAAHVLRRLPGAWRVLGIPTRRLRCIKHWVLRQSERELNWWQAVRAPCYQHLQDRVVRWRQMPRSVLEAKPSPALMRDSYGHHNELFLAVLPGARVLGPSGVVLTPDGGVVEQSSWYGDFLSRDRCLTSWRLPRPERLVGPHYTIATPADEGYHHWFIDTLPRLWAMDRVGTDLRVICSVSKPWQIDSLKLLGLSEQQIVPLEHRYLQPDVLVLPSYVGEPGYHPLGCAWLRERLCPQPARRAWRRLYVTRRLAPRRRLVNEKDIEPLLEEYQFDIVEAERLTLREQIDRFAEAAVIMGPIGAGLTNMLFAPAGCKVLELRRQNETYNGFYILADTLGHEFWYLTCARASATAHVHGNAEHDDSLISVDALRATLEAMLASVR